MTNGLLVDLDLRGLFRSEEKKRKGRQGKWTKKASKESSETP